MMHRFELLNAHSSQMNTGFWGWTCESHTGHLPSHLSHSKPAVVPASLRHVIKSGLCLDMTRAKKAENSGSAST